MSRLIALAGVGLLLSGAARAQEFSYNGDTGPGFWAEGSGWETCSGAAYGARQSPIDISSFRVEWRLGKLKLALYPTTIDIFNNGHTIEQEYGDTGSWIRFRNQDYQLQQFHFHTMSEHAVGGEHALMELHAVFQNDAGDLVLSQLFEPGRYPNRFIQKLIDAGLPERSGNAVEAGELINLSEVLTSTRHYFTYSGSLTTPPCTEAVTWVVLAKPGKITLDQYQAFRRILGNNFRPLQTANGRSVQGSAGMWPKSGKRWP